MNQISVNLVGPGPRNAGLCNQLFQIASALSYAEKYNFEAVFPCLLEDKYGGYVNNILRTLSTEDTFHFTDYFGESDFSYAPIPKKDNSFCIVNSYLQSEKYFSENRELILNTFTLPEEDKAYLEDKYGDILKQGATSLHIRRTDYINLKKVYT